MSAATVMSNFYSSQYQVQNWMLAHMSNYPPPPQPDQQHYSPIGYPTSAGAQQLIDPTSHEHLQYSNLSQPIYPKDESSAPRQESNPQDHNLAQVAQELQQHARQEEQQRQQIQQATQQLHQQARQSQQTSFAPPSHSHPQQGTPEQPQKTNRLRKACDSCSIRKVKCDESGPPCRACSSLDIPCTFERPSRRRGPPNRHAEAVKRRRLEENGAGSISGTSSPSSPTHAAYALAALSSHAASGVGLSADTICPLDTLDLLIDDFFTYIHPLCPFPHEPSFREAWKRREDLTNSSFLALLASMIGALVASFPRKPRRHLKAQRTERLFPSHMSLVHRCQKVCSLARGPGYLESEHLSVYDAATSYFIALMGLYTFRWRQGRLYFGECLSIIRTLNLVKPNPEAATPMGQLPTAMSLNAADQESCDHDHRQMDNITIEIGRRIFWTIFVGVKTMQELGVSFGQLQIGPATLTEAYPPLPAEVDDFCIYPTHNEPQPPGLLPMIAGFNANVRVFRSYDALGIMELAWGIDAIVDWDRQKKVLREALHRCKRAITELPAELVVYPNVGPLGQRNEHNGGSLHQNFAQPDAPELTAEERRRMQYEIQKANIYASSLATRSYIVTKYWTLVEAHSRLRSQQSQGPGSSPSSPGIGITRAGVDGMLPKAHTSSYDLTEHEMRDERDSIINDLLVVLGSISQVNMEPNANSFTMKIRAVASTLLEVPDQRKGQVALQAREYLVAFLDILMKLEHVSPANSDPGQPEGEDAELRHWADLREYQMKFAQQGGLYGSA